MYTIFLSSVRNKATAIVSNSFTFALPTKPMYMAYSAVVLETKEQCLNVGTKIGRIGAAVINKKS